MKTIIFNIGTLAGILPADVQKLEGAQMGHVECLHNAYLVIEDGIIAKPYLGVSVLTVSDDVKSYGLPAGASIQEIVADSPAEKAGLQINDIITKVGDTEITTSDELVDIVGEAKPGDILVLTIYRNMQTTTIEITVGEQVTQANPQIVQQSSNRGSEQQYNNFPWGFFNR